MTQYITLNVRLSNLQLNELKSRVKNGTDVTWSNNMVLKCCYLF